VRRLAAARVAPSPAVNQMLLDRGTTPIEEPTPLLQLLRRPELDHAAVGKLLPTPAGLDPMVAKQVEVAVKYEGYIHRMLGDVRRFKEMEDRRIPERLDFAAVPGLSAEVRERLAAVRPRSIGQASRIPGVTPAAVSILMVWCHRQGRIG
jgi:tRNA uridine 5-carboxymethylaminomethyl modification enzyme